MAEPPSPDPGILELLPVGVFFVDARWVIGQWNGKMAEWTGIKTEEALGRRLSEVLPRFGERRYISRLELAMDGGPPVVFSYQLHAGLFPDARGRGPHRVRYCTASSLPGTKGLVFTVEDRTEVAALVRASGAELARRRAAEEELKAAMAVREMLVREASHRIKNNLAVINGLVSLELDRAESDSARGFLADLGSRIRSIGLIHELLYKGDFGADLRLDEYLSRLCAETQTAFVGEAGGARLELDLEPVLLDTDATPYVGMMTAELLTNALKYGRVPGRESTVKVRLRLDPGAGGIEILVEDEGPGFPGQVVENPGSLGWKLLTMLADRVGGKATILSGGGGRVSLTLPGGRAVVAADASPAPAGSRG